MKIRNIIEEFVDMIKVKARYGDTIYSIYRNPSFKEFKEILEEQGGRPEVRFIIDLKGKAAYFFSSNLLHYRTSLALRIPYTMATRDKVNDKYIFGFGDYSKTKGKVETPYWKEVRKYKWLKKFFGV